nr:coiled-coil domain-containing protein 106 isoform X2 [Danio rerio]|eukprot:XP_021328430.1 coiled-coil domain-containing protein 106 isoform X2 [Danio rerio]
MERPGLIKGNVNILKILGKVKLYGAASLEVFASWDNCKDIQDPPELHVGFRGELAVVRIQTMSSTDEDEGTSPFIQTTRQLTDEEDPDKMEESGTATRSRRAITKKNHKYNADHYILPVRKKPNVRVESDPISSSLQPAEPLTSETAVLPARKRVQSKNPSSLSGVLPVCKKPRVESDPTCSGLQPSESLTSDRAAAGVQPAVQPTRDTAGAPTAQLSLEQAKKTIEIQKEKILHLQEKVDFLMDDRNYLRSRLEDALRLRCETVNSPALTASSSTIVTSQKNQSTDTSSDSSESTDSSDSEPKAKKKKKGKKSKRQKKSKTKTIDIKRVRTPEDSINRYNKVLQLVRDGLSIAEAYNKVKIDRNTIVMQAPIAELATANPTEFKSLRATFKKGESVQKFANLCLTRCLAQSNMKIIKQLKESNALLDIFKK